MGHKVRNINGNIIRRIVVLLLIAFIFTGCNNNITDKKNQNVENEQGDENTDLSENQEDKNVKDKNVKDKNEKDKNKLRVNYPYQQDLNIIEDNYRTYYEVFLYSYYDSNGDGIGDIKGLIEKLDYINDGDSKTEEDMGFNGIWLMPIMPSDTYHKYDVKDYYNIDPQYGTMEDFERLVEECDKRGIRIILDLVINHSSHKHPWFLSAVKSLGIEPCGKTKCIHEELCREHNPYVTYYNFVKGKPSRTDYYFTGVEDWYYEAVFTDNMPDLNLDNLELRAEIEDIMSFWLEKGVDGFRLDAALHFFSDDTEKNTEVLAWLNQFIKEKNQQYYMVAEVWTNFSTYAPYYESGIDSLFNFAFAMETGKIVKTLNYTGYENSGKAFGEAMIQVQKGLNRYSNTAIDAPFFTNHDTARAAGFFSGNVNKTKLAAGMNLMMSGNVFVYYGEEIGMSGSGRDENKRAPMYWSTKNTKGMTKGPEAMESVTHRFGTLEEQMEDPLSLYHYYKRAIRLRNENPEIARGEISYLNDITDIEICAISKTHNDSQIYMFYNFSEETKQLKLDRSKYDYEGIRGYLTVQGEEVTLEGDTLTLPAFAIAIMK